MYNKYRYTASDRELQLRLKLKKAHQSSNSIPVQAIPKDAPRAMYAANAPARTTPTLTLPTDSVAAAPFPPPPAFAVGVAGLELPKSVGSDPMLRNGIDELELDDVAVVLAMPVLVLALVSVAVLSCESSEETLEGSLSGCVTVVPVSWRPRSVWPTRCAGGSVCAWIGAVAATGLGSSSGLALICRASAKRAAPLRRSTRERAEAASISLLVVSLTWRRRRCGCLLRERGGSVSPGFYVQSGLRCVFGILAYRARPRTVSRGTQGRY
ncbi:hypothetical protein LXA43DRAFT_497872 [Ganoderma leucocontextum]|nr:hypothetical protein LXA43DRAFT_497872 [Ganoderma leucocontextum]